MKRILSLLAGYIATLVFVGFAYSADQIYNLAVEIIYNDETPSDAAKIAKKIMEDNSDADQMKVVSNLLTERSNRVGIIEVRANLKFTDLTPQRASEISRELAEAHGKACIVEIKWEMVNDPVFYTLHYKDLNNVWTTITLDANGTTANDTTN
jgi:hypothetical protein